MAKPKTAKRAYKLDIMSVLEAIDTKQTSFYNNLTEEERKGFVPLIALRWLSAVSDRNAALQRYQLLAANDLVAGHVQIYFSGITSVAPFVKSGKLRALAVTTSARSALLPDTPTAAEVGLSGLDVSNWLGMLAPARTPEPVIGRLYSEIAKITNSADMKAFLLAQGAEPALLPPAKFGEVIRTELAKWGKVIRDAGIRGE